MKRIQILIIFFIVIMLSGQAGCFSGFFTPKENNLTNKSDLLNSQTSNTGNTGADSSIFQGTGNSQKDDEGTTKDTSDNLQESTTATSLDSSGSQEDNDSGNDNSAQENQVPKRYAVIVGGVSYDKQHYEWFLNSTRMAYDLLKNNNYLDENIYYLFESDKELDVDYKATIDNFKKAVEDLQKRVSELDTIVLFLIGHGTYNGTNSYYSLNGYNLSDTEMADMFKKIKRDKLIFVFSQCNSGGFIDDLSGENTVVITSTRKDESNRAAFIEPFLTSLTGAGDANSNGKVSFAEAFNYASSDVKKQYKNNNWGALIEHAQLDDNGDKVSHEAPMPVGLDGNLAITIYLK